MKTDQSAAQSNGNPTLEQAARAMIRWLEETHADPSADDEGAQEVLAMLRAALARPAEAGEGLCGQEFWTDDADYARCDRPKGHKGDCYGEFIEEPEEAPVPAAASSEKGEP